MLSRERGDLTAIAASGHRAPPAAMGARGVVEEKAAARIGAQANRSLRPFHDDFRGGTGNGGEQPVQAVFAGDILDAPGLILLEQFVVALGDPQDGVHGFDPLAGNAFFSDHSGKYALKRFAEVLGFFE
jgi:hypothetical protein